MEKITGLPAETVLGKQAQDIFSLMFETGITALLERALRGETCHSGDIKFQVQATNRAGWVSGTYVPHRNTAGEIIGVIGVIHDFTTRKQLEAQLQQSQKMEAIGHLAGGIAHDFNNLLTPILGYSNLSITQLPTDSKLRTQIEAIQEAAERASALTRQLLAFSLKQVLRLNLLNLNTEIESFRPMLKSLLGEPVDIRLHLDPALGKIKADASQIHQILLNLAINARDAMPNGGSVTFGTSMITIRENQISQPPELAPGTYVHVTVSDTGTGMDGATMARIFEPFFTTKKPGRGTGLGLATVYGIVKQHGGYISPISLLGQGTTFNLFFPEAETCNDTKKSPREKSSVSLIPPPGHETILLVEDEISVRKLAQEILHTHGYTVLSAPDATQALALADEHGPTITLLLTDVIMPGMNGKQLYTRLKSKYEHLKVLYMSGYAEDVITHEGILDKNTQLLSKPFSIQDFLNAIHNILHPATPASAYIQTPTSEVMYEKLT